MYLRIGYELAFDLPASTPLLLMLYVHPSEAPRLRRPQRLHVEPEIPIDVVDDGFATRLARLTAPQGKLHLWYDNVIEHTGLAEPRIDGAKLHTLAELPAECLQYLLPSRYCEIERLGPMAWDLFGKTPATWERVQAV